MKTTKIFLKGELPLVTLRPLFCPLYGAVLFLFASCVAVHALSFAPAEIEKTNWEARQLTQIDINGDGLTDLAIINGVERSIDLFIQKKKPTLEASKAKEDTPPMTLSRFTRERIFTEAPANSFVFGDFSGKGKIELAYAAKRLGVVFMERNAAGRWEETHRISDVDILPYPNVMWAGKLTDKKDSPTSLVILVKGRLLVINDYKISASYGTLYEDSGYLTLNDINGDGRLDVIYDYDGAHGFAVRAQDAKGRFDSEMLLNYASETEKDFGFRGDRFYFFGGNTPFVEERKISSTPLKPASTFYGTFTDRAEGLLWQIDGAPVLVLADGKGAELTLYRQKDGAWGSPERFPSIKSVTSAVLIKGAKGDDALALFSPDEHAVGLAHWEESAKRITFPKLVELPDEPLSLFGLDGKAWVITRSEHDFYLQSLGADGTVGEKKKLEGLKRAPDFAIALNENGATLIGLFQSHDTANFYLISAKNELSVLKTPLALARSNFANIEESRIGRGHLSGSNSDDLLIAQRSTVRIFHFQDGQLALTDQALPINTDANFRFPFVQNGVLWVYDTKSDNWLKFERNDKSDGEKLWKNTAQVNAPSLDPISVIPVGTNGWIALARRAFYTLSPEVPGNTLTPVKRWESALKIDGYNWASLESFDKTSDKKTPSAILFSQKERILEIVSLGDAPKSLVNFIVYEQDPHFEGRKGEDVEPREIIAADVTGDGKPDLILLIHNKLIVYPQK